MKTTFLLLCIFLSLSITVAEAVDEKPSAESKGARIQKGYPVAALNGDGQSKDRQQKPRHQKQGKIAATQANVSYFSHPSNVLDFYKAKSKEPTPVALHIHGGGFRKGSKDGISQATLKSLLDAGISVVSVEYRLIGVAPLPTAHYDCARALQFIRSKAKEWNFDKTKVGSFGSSAGAQLGMWLAFHDDMSNPKSKDPIERQSTRLSCVATNNGQATMDLSWWVENIPGYDNDSRLDPNDLYRTKDKKKIAKIVEEISVINHLTKDDPPMYMEYRQNPDDPVPDDPKEASDWSVHHVQFGFALKEKADAFGIEADLKYPGSNNKYESDADFFITKFGKQ